MNNRERQRQYQKKFKREFPYKWFRYCLEPLENIEGWSVMLNDRSGQSWHLHHRDEIQKNVVVRKDELKSRGEYLHLPASKLVFMTESEHRGFHNSGERNPMHGKTGENATMYGRTGELCPTYRSDITKEDLHELYVVQRLSQKKIAEKFECSQGCISIKLKEFGISRK